MNVYLGGGIRDGEQEAFEDSQWREQVAELLADLEVTCLNPMSGKEYDPVKKRWTHYGFPLDVHAIFAQDRHSISRSDILIVDLFALECDHPCIGTLIELGLAYADTVRPKAIFIISDNLKVIQHPFIMGCATRIFQDREDCLSYVCDYIATLRGK
jgi:nucleoside 2-deoxyribosyltransferase